MDFKKPFSTKPATRAATKDSSDVKSMLKKTMTRTTSNLSDDETKDANKEAPDRPDTVAEQAVDDSSMVKNGDSFGELSILYNMHLHATFQAREECVLYAIHRKHFAAIFNRKGKRFHDYCKLLEGVSLLSPLVGSERWELACNAIGLVDFQPDERCLHQGIVRSTRRWYVIFSGSAVVKLDTKEPDGNETTEVLAHLGRSAHFGERSLLKGEAAAPVSIEAGPDGMCCLTFDGENIKGLLQRVRESGGVELNCGVREWWSRKAKGFSAGPVSQPTAFNRMSSGGGVELEELRKVCVLGRGGFGQVCLVTGPALDQRYALKTLSKGHILRRGVERLVNWERELLAMLDSPFVIKLYKTFKDPQHVYFLLEAALGGSLQQVVRDHPEVFMDDSPRGLSMAFYAACITAGIEHLHERKIVHRDMKPENILLDEQGYAKVCDLGFARFVLSKTNTLAGTPEYMAPEIIDFPHTHGSAVDWWGLGVLSFELLAGQTPFDDEGICEPMDRLLAIRRSQERGRLSFPYSFPIVAKNFVSQLLQLNPSQRLGGGPGGACDIRGHAMFNSLKFDFTAFTAQRMATPFQKEWQDPLVFNTANDFGMDHEAEEGLGLEHADSLFAETDESADHDKDWDINF